MECKVRGGLPLFLAVAAKTRGPMRAARGLIASHEHIVFRTSSNTSYFECLACDQLSLRWCRWCVSSSTVVAVVVALSLCIPGGAPTLPQAHSHLCSSTFLVRPPPLSRSHRDCKRGALLLPLFWRGSPPGDSASPRPRLSQLAAHTRTDPRATCRQPISSARGTVLTQLGNASTLTCTATEESATGDWSASCRNRTTTTQTVRRHGVRDEEGIRAA